VSEDKKIPEAAERTRYSCNGGFEHDFDSNEDSEYCANGCGEKYSIYTIKTLKDECERLQKRLLDFEGMTFSENETIAKLEAENERLKEELKSKDTSKNGNYRIIHKNFLAQVSETITKLETENKELFDVLDTILDREKRGYVSFLGFNILKEKAESTLAKYKKESE
jgi:hypothetical protein